MQTNKQSCHSTWESTRESWEPASGSCLLTLFLHMEQALSEWYRNHQTILLNHRLTYQTAAGLRPWSDLSDLSDHCLTYQTCRTCQNTAWPIRLAGLVRPLADLSDCCRTCQTTTRLIRLLQDLSDCYRTCQTYQIVAGFVDCHTINYQTTTRFVTLFHDLSVAWHVWLLKWIVSLFWLVRLLDNESDRHAAC